MGDGTYFATKDEFMNNPEMKKMQKKKMSQFRSKEETPKETEAVVKMTIY